MNNPFSEAHPLSSNGRPLLELAAKVEEMQLDTCTGAGGCKKRRLSNQRDIRFSSAIFVFALFLASISGSAQVAYVDALKNFNSVKSAVTQENYQNLGYAENVKALGAYNKQWLDGRAELTQRVKSAPYYLAAVEAAKTSSAKMAKLRALNTTVSDDELKEYAAITRAPALILRRDIDEDAGVLQLLNAIATCKANISQIPGEAARLTANDPRVLASQTELQGATERYNRMRAEREAQEAAAAAAERTESNRRLSEIRQRQQNADVQKKLDEVNRRLQDLQDKVRKR